MPVFSTQNYSSASHARAATSTDVQDAKRSEMSAALRKQHPDIPQEKLDEILDQILGMAPNNLRGSNNGVFNQ